MYLPAILKVGPGYQQECAYEYILASQSACLYKLKPGTTIYLIYTTRYSLVLDLEETMFMKQTKHINSNWHLNKLHY